MSTALIPLIVIELNNHGLIMRHQKYTCLEELIAVKGWDVDKDTIIDRLEDNKITRYKNCVITYASSN